MANSLDLIPDNIHGANNAMNEQPRPIEPRVSARTRPPRTALSTVLFAVILAVIVVVVAVVQASQSPQGLATAVGASASAGTSDPSAASADPAKGRDDAAAERQKSGDNDKNPRSARVGRDIRITAIDGDRVSLATVDGWRRTITVTPQTEITKGGQPIGVADLAVDDRVVMAQRRNDDGTYTVTRLRVVLPVTGGKVTAVDSDSITLGRRDGSTQVVTTTADTVYVVGGAKGTRADVVVGATVVVQGTESGSTFTATQVRIKPMKVAGTVTATSASTITVESRNGASTVAHVDAGTTYRVKGKDNATLADIKVGDRVDVRGTPRADGSIDAQRVRARTPKVKPQPTPTPTPGG